MPPLEYRRLVVTKRKKGAAAAAALTRRAPTALGGSSATGEGRVVIPTGLFFKQGIRQLEALAFVRARIE